MKKEALMTLLLCLILVVSMVGFGYFVADRESADTPTTGVTAPPNTTLPTQPTTAPSSSETTRPTTEPTESITEPTQSTVDPTTQLTNPEPTTEPTTTPTEPTTQPTEPTTQPTEPTTQPTEPPTEPTEPPTEPTTQPTEPPTEPTKPVEISLTAKKAFVYDLTAEGFLYILGDLDAPVEPASITKLFSAYVGLMYLSPDTLLTVGEEVTWIAYGSSRAYLEPGYQLTVEMCIQGMMIPSGNDAAYVLAVNAGRVIADNPQLSARDAYNTFVTEMNWQALKLGMTGTTFVNPDGMNEAGHYTTMRDMLKMAKLALDEPVIRDAAKVYKMTAELPSGQIIEWVNSNQMMNPDDPKFYSEYAIGLKTGSTSTAGKCLISAFQMEDRILIICVMGCPKNEDRYIDTLKMLEIFG